MAKTYTTVADKSNRDQFTEAMWDDQIRANINNLIVPPACRAGPATVGQSVANATDTDITWNQEQFDTDSMHDNATNPARITCSTVGIYCVTFGFFWSSNVTGVRDNRIHFNATVPGAIARNYDASQTAGFLLGSISTLYATSVNTDYFRSGAWQNSGGALNHGSDQPECFFSAVWCGRTA